MAFVNPDDTFEKQAARVLAFYQRVADVRDKHGSSETDGRRVNLNNVMMAANAAMTTLRLMSWAKLGGEGAFIQALGLAKPEYINPVTDDLLRAVRLFLLVEYQFQIETLFRNTLMALGRPANAQGFYNVAADVLTLVGILDVPIKQRILNVPALMRNSMHTNGIHYGWKGSTTIEVVNGAEFRFEHGQRVQCGSWFHIVTALSASLEIVGEILASSAVTAIKEIPDAYAQQAAGQGP